MVKADIYLNDKYLGRFVSAYNPITIDVTSFIKQKDNVLIVVLDSTEDNNVPPFGYAVDYLTYGGIYRGVSLNVHPKVYIEKTLVSGSSSGNISIKNIIGGNKEKSHEISYELYLNEKLIDSFDDENHTIKDVLLWDVDNPILYKLVSKLNSEYGESVYETFFGFRTIRFEKEGFYLNDKKIKI